MSDRPSPGGASARRRLLGGVAASYLQAGVATVVTFLAMPIYLRLLGQELYGLYLTATSWVAYLALARLGFPQAAGNQMAAAFAVGDPQRLAGILRSAVALAALLAAGAGALGAGLVAAGVVSPELFRGSPEVQRLAVPLLVASGVGFLLALPLQQFDAALRALQRVSWEQGVLAAGRLLSLGAGVGAVLAGAGVIGLAISQAAVGLTTSAACLVLVRRLLPREVWRSARASRAAARSLTGPGLHFFLLSLAGALIWNADNILISMYVGTAAVAPYAISNRLLTLTLNWLSMGIRAVTPNVTALWTAGEHARLEALILTVQRLGLAAVALLAVEFAFFGREFIRLWAGEAALVPPAVFGVFILAMLVRAFVLGFEVLLVATSQHTRYAYVAVAQGVANVLLSLLLVQRYGILGIALGTLLAYAVATAWFVPWSALRMIRLRLGRVAREVLAPIPVPLAVAVAAAAGLRAGLGSGDWPSWLAGTGLSALAFAAAWAALSMSPLERRALAEAAAWLRSRAGARRPAPPGGGG